MTQFYSDETRQDDVWALPDLEVFYTVLGETMPGDSFHSDEGDYLGDGYYYWFCFPGCLPDSEPIGPFSTEDEALQDARG